MRPAAAGSPDALTMGAFALVVMFGAGNFLAVRLSNFDLPPFWGAGLRFGLAAATFIVIALVLRLSWPRGRDLRLTVLYGALNFGAFFALMYWALTMVTAGVAVIVMAIVPMVTLLLSAGQGHERVTVRSVTGALLAFAGIAWMVVGPQHVVLPMAALAAMLLAAAAIGQSVIVAKRLSAQHHAMTNAVGMTVGTLLLLGLSLAVGESWFLPTQAEAVWAVIYLVTLGSVGLFVLLLYVVGRWTASATSYAFVLFPVATLVLEALIVGEPITVPAVIGAVVVMAGVWFGALSPGARRRASPPDGLPVAPAVEEL